ncbi:uncharacterized protein LOC144085006 isoform X8 [Stigmatopora argus]
MAEGVNTYPPLAVHEADLPARGSKRRANHHLSESVEELADRPQEKSGQTHVIIAAFVPQEALDNEKKKMNADSEDPWLTDVDEGD